MITNRAYKSTVEKWLRTRGSFIVKIKQDSFNYNSSSLNDSDSRHSTMKVSYKKTDNLKSKISQCIHICRGYDSVQTEPVPNRSGPKIRPTTPFVYAGCSLILRPAVSRLFYLTQKFIN